MSDKARERIYTISLFFVMIVLLLGFWIIPDDSLSVISGILGVSIPALVKLYKAIKRLQPVFDVEIKDAGDIVFTLPKNIGRIHMRFEGVGGVFVEGNGGNVTLSNSEEKKEHRKIILPHNFKVI